MTLDLRQFFKDHSAPDGLPILKPHEWAAFVEEFPVARKTEVYAALTEHLIEWKVPFPRPPTTESDALNAFSRLRRQPWDAILHNPRDGAGTSYTSRQPYEHWTPDRVLGVVGLGAPYNEVSDHFQWNNRLWCRGWGSKSPLELWHDPDNLRKVDWIFYSFPEDRVRLGLTRDDYVATFRLRTYTATQFRPQVAKAFFDWFSAGTIFDISCGWGDRLAGFYTSRSRKYVGCDPNRAVWDMYQKQCLAYEEWLGWKQRPRIEHFQVGGYDAFRVSGSKEVVIVNGPAEDLDWSQEGPADLIFASPPYFAVERYAADQGEEATTTQSWSRYPKFEAWRDTFLYPVVDRVTAQLRPGGVLALNMADPTFGTRRHHACDPLIDRMVSQGMVYDGLIAMAMKKRPSTEQGKGAVTTRYAEPVWILRTPGPALPRFGVFGVDAMFGEAG